MTISKDKLGQSVCGIPNGIAPVTSEEDTRIVWAENPSIHRYENGKSYTAIWIEEGKDEIIALSDILFEKGFVVVPKDQWRINENSK